MTISEKDIKKLWGLAAGKCSYPECNTDCIKFIDHGDPTVIGEMAHIIAKSKDGPRGNNNTGGEDTYENLILLCPTHHTLIDKAPVGNFPAKSLLEWKKKHEERVNAIFLSPLFNSKRELFIYIKHLLIANKSIWTQFGPESDIAHINPVSTAATIWALKKLDTILPNNSKIVSALKKNNNLLSLADFEIAQQFIEHSIMFEENCYNRMDSDSVPRFPVGFEKLINEEINNAK